MYPPYPPALARQLYEQEVERVLARAAGRRLATRREPRLLAALAARAGRSLRLRPGCLEDCSVPDPQADHA